MAKHRSFTLDKFLKYVDDGLMRRYFAEKRNKTLPSNVSLTDDSFNGFWNTLNEQERDDIEEELQCINDSDLTSISKEFFSALKKQKYLLFDQYDFENESYIDKQGNERFLQKVNGRWIATSTEDPEMSPLYLKEQDLNRYSFNVQPLLAEIKLQNRLSRNSNKISDRVHYIGEKIVLQNSAGIFIAFLSYDKQAEYELFGLRAKVGKIDRILVLCPSYTITSQDLNSRLASQNIICLTFKDVFKSNNYSIDFSKAKFKQVDGSDTPNLTKKQTDDYTKYEYKCYDRMHIPGTAPRKSSNDLIINGHKIKMPDEPFPLLIELVVKLKKGKGGWLSKYTEPGKYQIWDRLRKPIEGSLLKKDAKEFIENDGSKHHRISTHPDFVTYDRSNLLKHPDNSVRMFAKKLPK